MFLNLVGGNRRERDLKSELCRREISYVETFFQRDCHDGCADASEALGLLSA